MVCCVVWKINHKKYTPKYVTCRDYKNYNPNTLKNDLKIVDWSPVFKTTDVNRALNHLNEILTVKFNTHAHYTTKS